MPSQKTTQKIQISWKPLWLITTKIVKLLFFNTMSYFYFWFTSNRSICFNLYMPSQVNLLSKSFSHHHDTTLPISYMYNFIPVFYARRFQIPCKSINLTLSELFISRFPFKNLLSANRLLLRIWPNLLRFFDLWWN